MPIIINDFEITDDAVHSEMQHHRAESVDEARHRAARALVIRQLLLAEAVELKLLDSTEDCPPSQEEEAIDALLQGQVSVPDADETSCRRYYEHNNERFIDQKSGELFPFDFVHQHVQDYLQARSLQTGIGQYIRILAGKARIVGFDMEGSDSPLVQ